MLLLLLLLLLLLKDLVVANVHRCQEELVGSGRLCREGLGLLLLLLLRRRRRLRQRRCVRLAARNNVTESVGSNPLNNLRLQVNSEICPLGLSSC